MTHRPNQNKRTQDPPIPLLEHLEELRKRIIISVVWVALLAVCSSRLVPHLLRHLVVPVGSLVFINPTEAFWANIKIAIFLGVYFSLPITFYQLSRFTGHALKRSEKQVLIPFSLFAFILFNIGAFFSYFIVVPLGVRFLLSYSRGILTPMISVNSYLSFLLVMIFSFGLIFELPLIISILTALGITTPAYLIQYRRVAIIGVFVIAAVLTPPDVFTQALLALPLLFLYEISILIARIIHKKKDS